MKRGEGREESRGREQARGKGRKGRGQGKEIINMNERFIKSSGQHYTMGSRVCTQYRNPRNFRTNIDRLPGPKEI